jgi:hypothetical protein
MRSTSHFRYAVLICLLVECSSSPASAQDAAAPPPAPTIAEQEAAWQRGKLERLLGPQATLFQQGLDSIGLTHADFRIDVEAMNILGGQTRYRLPIVDMLLGDPWQLSPWSHAITDSLLDLSGNSADVLVAAQARMGQSVRFNIPQYSPLTKHKDRVAELNTDALGVALYELTGDVKWQDPVNYAQVPAPVAEASALFCFVLPQVLEYRRLALEVPMQRLGLDPQETFEHVLELAINRANSVTGAEDDDLYVHENVALLESLADNVDFSYLNAGATLLAVCVEDMAKTLQAAEAELLGQEFWFQAHTSYGRIDLLGFGADSLMWPKDEMVALDDHLLLLNTRGDNFFSGAAGTASWKNPVTVCIDLEGNDHYTGLDRYSNIHESYSPGALPARAPSLVQGCGIFGYGILLDLAGDDVYRANEFGQGCGIFGVGILRDASGNDSYLGTGHLQGSGWFGSGVLIDSAGDDSYSLYQFCLLYTSPSPRDRG